MSRASDGISSGARDAYAALSRRTAAAEAAATREKARADAAERRARAVERDRDEGLAHLDAKLDAIVERLDRLERKRAPATRQKVIKAPLDFDEADVLWRVKSIAAFLGLREKAAQHRIDRGEIPTFRLGGTICARRSTLNAWLAKQEAGGRP